MPRPLTADGIAQFCEDRTGTRPRVEETSSGGFRLYIDPETAMDAVILEWYGKLLDYGSVAHTIRGDNTNPPFVDLPPDRG